MINQALVIAIINMKIIYKIKMVLILIKMLKNDIKISYSQLIHKIVQQIKKCHLRMFY
jgi:hypothetical protein